MTFTGMSPFISREICFVSKLNESTYIGELSSEDIENVWNSFNTIVNKIKNKEYSYNIYLMKNIKYMILLYSFRIS